MRQIAVFLTFFLLFAGTATAATKPKQYAVTTDPQALQVAQACFTAMGGAQALAAYQDSVVSGTVNIASGSSQPATSYPIRIESKGLRETRVELQKPAGKNIRIVNQGMGVIIRPNGAIKKLYSNNTFHEHVNHIPLLSVLAELGSTNINLLYKGTAQVQNQTEDVIEIDFIPNLANAAFFASSSATLLYVNQTTQLVDKIQRASFYEGDEKHTFNEETYFSNYQSVNGVLVPYHVSVFVDGQPESDFVFTSAQLNVGLPDSDFAIPQGN